MAAPITVTAITLTTKQVTTIQAANSMTPKPLFPKCHFDFMVFFDLDFTEAIIMPV